MSAERGPVAAHPGTGAWRPRLGITALVTLAVALDVLAARVSLLGYAGGRVSLADLLIDLLLMRFSTLVAGVLALALVWRAQARIASRVLALFLALLGYFLAADVLWPLMSSLHVRHWVMVLVDTGTPAAGIAGVAALLRFSAVFPDVLCAGQLRALRRLRAPLLSARVVWGAALVLFVGLVLPAQLVALTGAHLVGPLVGASKLTVFALVLGAFAAAVGNLRSGYRHADEEGRRRIFWLLEAFVAGGTLLLVASAVKGLQLAMGFSLPLREWYAIALYLAFLVILAGLAIAMFFSGALDPALAIRRTAVFGLVTLTMVFVFAGVENAMQNLVAERLHMSDHLSGLISGGLVALTFDPIKVRFNRLVERWSGHEDKRRTDALDRQEPPHPLVDASA